jgi:hypothetical protein
MVLLHFILFFISYAVCVNQMGSTFLFLGLVLTVMFSDMTSVDVFVFLCVFVCVCVCLCVCVCISLPAVVCILHGH